MCEAFFALQEIQVIAIMMHRIALWFSGKAVALHLNNCNAKAYLCNQSSTVSPFLSRLACLILSLTENHSITLTPVQCGS